MKLVYLPANENRQLRRIIQLEYAREETSVFIDTVASILNNPYIKAVVATYLIDVVNMVILDNLLRFVRNKDSLSLVSGMQNNTLGVMFDIGLRHYSGLITEEVANSIESLETEKDISKALSSYVNYLYLNNKEEIDYVILQMFEIIYSNFGHLEFNQHRVTFVEESRPVVILTGGIDAVYNANA